MPDDLVYIPSRSDIVRHGASLSALCELAERHDYVLVETTLFNAFFVQRDLYDQYLSQEVPETTIEALHEITMGTQLYQLYDGTLKLHGCRKMLWHRLPIDEKKLQVLAPEQRLFPFAPPPLSISSADDRALSDSAVDMAPYCMNSPKISDREACATALWMQLKKDGFALVRGTGVPRKQCQDALRATNALLQEADEVARRSCLTKDRARRGYSPMCTENFASLVGENAPNDLVRKFRVGPFRSNTATTSCIVENGANGDSSPLLRPNVWPSTESWNEKAAFSFRSNIEAYYELSCTAAHEIVCAICDGIAADRPDLAESMKVLSMKDSVDHTSILTLLSYRTGTRHKRKQKEPLVAPHTDVGVITMLLHDVGDCAMLQRNHRGSEKENWIDVALPTSIPEDPVFIVNIGDCMSELSCGSLPSTLHRVVPRLGPNPRNCLALFVGLEPQEKLIFPNGEAMSYEEWRKRRITRAQTILKGGAK